MYTQDAGTWDTLVKGLLEHKAAILYVGQDDRRDGIYTSIHRRVVIGKKLPDSLTVDRHPDLDKYTRVDGYRYAYMITFNPYENNKQAAKMLSKEW